MSDNLTNMELGLIIALAILGFIVLVFILYKIYSKTPSGMELMGKASVLRGYDDLKTEDQIDVYNRIKAYLEQQDTMLNQALDKIEVSANDDAESLPEESDDYGDTLRLSKR